MIPSLSGILASLLGLKRTCPRCGETQIVSREHKQETVPCKNCGAPIPPPGS